MLFSTARDLLSCFSLEDETMFDLEVSLKRNEANMSQTQEWWIVNQTESGPIQKDTKFHTGLEVYVFSDQVSPPSLGFLAGYGYF